MPIKWGSLGCSYATQGVCFLAVTAMSASVFAGGVPDFRMTLTGDGQNINYDPVDFGTREALGNGVFRYIGSLSWLTSANPLAQHEATWNVTVDSDPFVNASVTFLNGDTTNVQPFSLLMSVVLTVPQSPSVIQTGSVQGNVTDFNGDGAFMGAQAGDSVYKAMYNGVTVQKTLLDDGSPGSSVSSAGAGSTTAFTPANFSQAGAGLNAFDTINLRLAINLGSGDLASMSGIFNVEAVPGPAGLSVLAMGGLFARRRRRKA